MKSHVYLISTRDLNNSINLVYSNSSSINSYIYIASYNYKYSRSYSLYIYRSTKIKKRRSIYIIYRSTATM